MNTDEELQQELRRLRTEVQQLRELVNALFNAVFEDAPVDWDAVPKSEDMYN